MGVVNVIDTGSRGPSMIRVRNVHTARVAKIERGAVGVLPDSAALRALVKGGMLGLIDGDLSAPVPVPEVPMGARIAVLAHSSECGVWPLAGRNHAPSLAIARRHAFVNTQWDIPGQHLDRKSVV